MQLRAFEYILQRGEYADFEIQEKVSDSPTATFLNFRSGPQGRSNIGAPQFQFPKIWSMLAFQNSVHFYCDSKVTKNNNLILE